MPCLDYEGSIVAYEPKPEALTKVKDILTTLLGDVIVVGDIILFGGLELWLVYDL